MPRPDVAAIGTNYRRIPILSIGRDIYNDTRLILRKLEELYPHEHRSLATTPDSKIWERLFESWVVDSGVFVRASQLIPTNTPLMNDPKFVKDRAELSGRSWSKENIEKMRAESLVEIKSAFEFLETTLLADGRAWILKTEEPSLADIEAVWPFHWLTGLKGALPEEYISGRHFPKVYAWVARFHTAAAAAAKKAGKPKTVKGPEALATVSSSTFAESEGSVDASDPTGLAQGEEIEVWPIDSGFSCKDRGRLVALDGKEIVIDSLTKDGTHVRIHAPRHGFRVRRVGKGSKI